MRQQTFAKTLANEQTQRFEDQLKMAVEEKKAQMPKGRAATIKAAEARARMKHLLPCRVE